MKKTVLGVSIGVIAALVLGGGAAFAYKAQVFTSPKNLVLQALQQETMNAESNAMTQPISADFNIKFNNIYDPQISPIYDSLVNQINGSSLDLNTILDEQHEKAKFALTLRTSSDTYSSDVYLDQSNAVISTAGIIPLVNQLARGSSVTLPEIPPYLTDSGDPQIQQFWNGMSQNETNISPQIFTAGKQLAELVVNAVPDQYFTRPALNTIRISISQNGWLDIIKAEVKSIYANPQQWADAINAVNAATGQGGTPISGADLTSTPETTVLQSIDTLNEQRVFTLDPTVVTVTRNLFSNQEHSDIQGGFAINQPYGVSGNITFYAQSEYGSVDDIAIPVTDSSNSESINNMLQNFSQDQNQGYGQF